MTKVLLIAGFVLALWALGFAASNAGASSSDGDAVDVGSTVNIN